jgi:DNA-binding GntR family transcriptional regulator
LEQDGLVEHRPHHGVLVAVLTRERVLDAYTVRAHLENLAAQLAAPRLQPPDVAGLERLLARMEREAQADDAPGLLRTDVDFHQQICELSGNRVLLRLWKSVGPHAWTLFSGMQQVGMPLDTLVTRHRVVLAALVAGDPAEAGRVAREHILEVARNVIDHRFPQGASGQELAAAAY